MERDKLVTSLLKKLSPELKLLAVSVQNGPGLHIHQWKGISKLSRKGHIKTIEENIGKRQSIRDVLLAGVKALAADVEEILNEIAGNQTVEEPSTNCFPSSTGGKTKALPTVTGALRNRILSTSSLMATLNNRYGFGQRLPNIAMPNSMSNMYISVPSSS